MSDFKLLPRKEKKIIIKLLKEEFGIDKVNFEFFRTGKKRIWVCSRDLVNLDLRGLKLHSIGFYLGEWDGDLFRLSFDATQLFSKNIKKNIIEFNDNQAKAWFEGYDVPITANLAQKYDKRYVVVKYKEDMIGCGKVRNGKVWNYVPKDRRQEKDISEEYDIAFEYE